MTRGGSPPPDDNGEHNDRSIRSSLMTRCLRYFQATWGESTRGSGISAYLLGVFGIGSLMSVLIRPTNRSRMMAWPHVRSRGLKEYGPDHDRASALAASLALVAMWLGQRQIASKMTRSTKCRLRPGSIPMPDATCEKSDGRLRKEVRW